MWKKLACKRSDLNLDITLGGGQSFRWSKNENGEWTGIIHNLVYTLKQEKMGNLMYCVHTSSKHISQEQNGNPRKRLKKTFNSDILNQEDVLKEYLNLDFNLELNYKKWSEVDENFKNVCQNYQGVRILRQDPVENLFSFICSSNNNIQRITSMVGKLCSNYGDIILHKEDKAYYTFPPVERLAKDEIESELRDLGFGYRAKFINQTAKYICQNKTPDWLISLRNIPYKEAHESLLNLPGVGAKVADCVCLMSLDKYDAVPVDTHIWQVTVRDYLPHLKTAKTMTNKMYQEIGDFYRTRFGDYAGWANTVLFAADLKMFKKN